jgi:hypothetical protein
MPDPYRLADEIRRILSPNGIWINYGPSGPLKSVWRFDQAESAAFFESAGFEVIESEAHRTTNLDLSGRCPTWAFRSLICYLTAARKMGAARIKPTRAIPASAELGQIIPQHFPGAQLVERQSLGTERSRKVVLRHERIPGRMESFELSNDAARMMTLVDGKKTVLDIAALLEESGPAQGVEKTIGTFGRYVTEGLLGWRKPTG